ncbi:ogr/Delta-like zinc finger family protein [Pseudomonas putida]|nr:ogr/Delta-like zinc finger family protein [Pseudomonas putida]
MRINCTECGGKAHISKVEEVPPDYAKMTCICLSSDCMHGFVMELNFSHTLKPSKLSVPAGHIMDRISRLTDDQRAIVLQQLEFLV